MMLEDRRVRTARYRLETIAERLFEALRRRGVGIDIYQPMRVLPERAEVIDAVRMLGVAVGVDDSLESLNAGREHLSTDIRACIDQHAGDAAILDALDKD